MVERDDEQRWVSRCREGDAEAFEELVKRHQRMIHALTYRMTGSLSDAEDLAQETFIQAYRQIGSYRGEAGFSSWLYRIGVNTCLNWKRRSEHRERVQTEWANRADVSAEPDREKDSTARVQEALLQLKPEQRAAVILTTYDGMNHAEAARVLGCSETTVSWRIFTARKKLKRWLQTQT